MPSKRFAPLALGAALCALLASPSIAITTSMGQSWSFEPDAWTRSNAADTSYFGWDVIEFAGVGPLGSGRLDDTTPDLGASTTAVSPHIVQSPESLAVYGHRSATGNYYSGFLATAYADDTISAIAPTPVGPSGGFTTVVLQVIGQPASTINDLRFTMDASSVAWTKQKDLYAINDTGAGIYWQEWTAPGDNLPFSINMGSATSSRGIDAFQIDTFWSTTGPVVNAISAIPEPSTFGLGMLGLLGIARFARREGRQR